MPVFNNILAGAAGQTGGAAAGPIKSVRFNSGDSAYLNRTPSSASNRKTWTWSSWVKRSSLTSSYENLFSSGDGGNNWLEIGFTSQKVYFYWQDASSGTNIQTSDRVLRDCSAWMHLVVAVDTTQSSASDRLKIYVNGSQITMGGTNPTLDFVTAVNNTFAHGIGSRVSESNLYFDGYLADIYFIDGSALDPTSFGAFDDNGVWQAAAYSGTFGTNGFHLFDFANESGIGDDSSGNDNDFTVNNLSTGVYSGTKPKWYTSTTLYTTKADVIANATDRGQNAFTLSSDEFVYLVPNAGGIVGELCHPVGSEYPVLFYVYVRSSGDTSWYNTGSHGVGEADTFQWENTTGTPAAYDYTNTEDLYLIGDTRTSGQPDANSKMSGSFPALVNIVAEADVLRDVPTNGDSSDDTGAGGEVSGNYCTMNPVHSTATLENGNLDVKPIVGHSNNYGTFGMSSGKWYWEVYRGAYSANSGAIGFHGSASANKKLGTTWPGPGSNTDQHTVYFNGASSALLYNGQSGASFTFSGSSTPALPTGWVSDAGYYMFCVDMDNQKAWIGKDGVWWGWNGSAYTTTGGDPANGTNPTFVLDANDTYFPFTGAYDTATGNYTYVHNFGQRAWKYAAPSGFKALCTANLPTPDIADGSTAFDAVLYSGTSNAQSITGLGFSPDLVWTKNRGASASHAVYDSVRGAGELIRTNENSAETTVSSRFTSFDSNGFSIGSYSTENNASSNTYVSWAWDAGSSTVSNTDGSITSSVRANQTAGFSIVSYTSTGGSSATIGHGLNAAPDFVLCKRLDAPGDWWAGHVGAGWTQGAYLQVSDAFAANSNWWNNTAPTSSVVTLGSYPLTGSSGSYIAYCFTSVAGYSAMGSYTGNGDADGPFVALDFQPAFVLIKSVEYGGNWFLYDNGRFPNNPTTARIYANTSDAESAVTDDIDFVSNGFKIRTSATSTNGNGNTHIFAAFAENPFQANGGLAR